MKMFLTRLGENSRMIVTGDPSQVDLPHGQTSGLAEAVKLLAGVEGVGHVAFTHEDVIRHELVARIVAAYDRAARARTSHELVAAAAPWRRPRSRSRWARRCGEAEPAAAETVREAIEAAAALVPAQGEISVLLTDDAGGQGTQPRLAQGRQADQCAVVPGGARRRRLARRHRHRL